MLGGRVERAVGRRRILEDFRLDGAERDRIRVESDRDRARTRGGDIIGTVKWAPPISKPSADTETRYLPFGNVEIMLVRFQSLESPWVITGLESTG